MKIKVQGIEFSIGTGRSVGRVACLLIALVALAYGRCALCADVVIDSCQTFQTIEGWGQCNQRDIGALWYANLLDPDLCELVSYQIIDHLVDDMGLTGHRLSQEGSQSAPNDDGDCDVINWTKFNSAPVDQPYIKYVIHWRDRVVARGDPPSFYSSSGSTLKPWHYLHPGEGAQRVWANALYWNTNGITLNYAVIANEPANGNLYTAANLADIAKALGPRLAALGLPTRVQFPESMSPSGGWNLFITQVINDPYLWPYVGRISYHQYGSLDPYRSYFRDFGKSHGIPTAQTENASANVNILYDDLTLGGVSYWEASGISGDSLTVQPGYTTVTPSSLYFQLRQVMHYVRPGAVRIGAASSDSSLRVLAFSKNGAETVVFWNNTGGGAQTINLSGVVPGTYGLAQSTGTLFQELGVQTVSADGTLTLNIDANVVATLYPRPGTNLPPTIMKWGANPSKVVAPASTTTLSVSANDPDLDSLMYNWSVTNQPGGANAVLATSNAATTAVSGLSVEGTYVFNVDVRDGVNTASKQVYLRVVSASNQPPFFGLAGTQFGLSNFDGTNAMTVDACLPLSTLTLFAAVTDPENDSLTGLWSLLSQPSGGNVNLSSTGHYGDGSFRATVTSWTVIGDYTFQIVVNDPTHSITQQVILALHPANSAPVIDSISAAPASLTLPVSSTQLSAAISDVDGDPLEQWWVVKSAPAGARPLFDHQGTTNTTVSNLVIPGSYTFTLRAFDDLNMTTKDKAITVSAAPGAPVITSAATASVIAGTPFTYTITANNSPTGYSATHLAPGLVCSNAVISGTPTTVGTCNIQLSAANASGTGYGNLALTVQLPLPVITSSTNADGLVNTAFAYTIAATPLVTTYGATDLPAGLSVNAVSGAITGTPTSVGTNNVTIVATNATGSASATLTIVIYSGTAPVPVITSVLNATGTVSVSFNYQIAAANNPTGFFAIGLPAGLSFDQANGGISGTPALDGTFNVTIRASNRGGTGSATLVLTINPEPRPRFETFLKRSDGFGLSFSTLANHHYSVVWLDNLSNAGNWAELIGDIPGDGTIQTVTDPATNLPARFYRIKARTP